MDNDVLSPTSSRVQPVFRKETDNDWTQYPPESEIDEPPRRNKIVRRLMRERMKTTWTRRNEDAMLDVKEEDVSEPNSGRRGTLREKTGRMHKLKMAVLNKNNQDAEKTYRG